VFTRIIIINNMFAVCSSLHVTCTCLGGNPASEAAVMNFCAELTNYPPPPPHAVRHKLSPRGLFRVYTQCARAAAGSTRHTIDKRQPFFFPSKRPFSLSPSLHPRPHPFSRPLAIYIFFAPYKGRRTCSTSVAVLF